MPEAKLSLFLTFHLNLAYSSIQEEQRAEVIQKCYWPLLGLIERTTIPIAIEATAYTLECINTISPEWIVRFKDLCKTKKSEFIGSGYCQIIGPLVPAKVNAANLLIGNHIYSQLLQIKPEAALVNEQAWSTGLIDTYLEGGFKAVIMEWNNPYALHPEWSSELRYHPQKLMGLSGKTIDLIWNDSIVFQKFQRVIHGDLSADNLSKYLQSHLGDHPRCLSLYGNDAEIFNFRPGRFETEAAIKDNNEWVRIETLLTHLQNKPWIKFIFPSETLHHKHIQADQIDLTLSTAKVPIPVKKQSKYNSVRWAVSGKDDCRLNTLCYQLYKKICTTPVQDPRWKELCYFWSSDFRTHITQQRYNTLLKTLADRCSTEKTTSTSLPEKSVRNKQGSNWLTIQKHARYLELTSSHLKIRLNILKGMSIESLIALNVSNNSLLGTIEHGYFDNINYGADFFSGHMIFSSPGRHQVTDLYPVQPNIEILQKKAIISSEIATPEMKLCKKIIVFSGSSEVTVEFNIHFKEKPRGSIRLGHITLNPDHFDSKSLFFQTHNGGDRIESFQLKGENVNHFTPVSNLVSATTCLGLTEEVLDIGDKSNYIRLSVDKTRSSCVGGIHYVPMKGTYLLRHVFSAMESDDTSIHGKTEKTNFRNDFRFSLQISAHKTFSSSLNI